MSAEGVTSTPVDVVIIGGGLAGLSAALCLSDYNASHPGTPTSFVVLEREDRLGGRTFTDPQARDLDFGGAYVGATQNYILYLLRRYSISPIPEYLPPDKQWVFEFNDGRISFLPGDNPQDLPGELNCAAQLLMLDTMVMEVRNVLTEPNRSRFAELDKLSVADWLKQQRDAWDATEGKNPMVGMSPDTAQAFVCSVRSAFSVEPEELSFFYLLYYAACAGSYSALVDVAGGPGAAEGARLPLGTQELVEKITADVTQAGALTNIVQNATVKSIVQDANGALVTTAAGKSWRAQHVIMAMSPATVGRITHEAPAVSADKLLKRDKLEKGMAACRGRTIKGFVKFKTAFWRELIRGEKKQGLMGFALSAGSSGTAESFERYPLDWTLDNVWVDPATNEQRNSLMTFIVGAAADYWIDNKTREQRATAVIEHLRRIFEFQDSDLFDSSNITSNYVERNWPGAGPDLLLPAPAAMLGPGQFLGCYQALRQPIGVVHYGGSESALEWNGYMDGAVQSGFRTANEVLAALKRPL